jgi:hypothetical protein
MRGVRFAEDELTLDPRDHLLDDEISGAPRENRSQMWTSPSAGTTPRRTTAG